MTSASRDTVLGSGFVELTPESLEALPEEPGWFRLRSAGQRVMYVGHAGERGLRGAVRAASTGQHVTGFATVEFELCDEASARAAAEADIDSLKPLYNDGFGRFRNPETQLPKKGHRVRPAMQNP